MKYRSDFVTNSSSSSFLIYKRKLSPQKIDAIKNHIEYANLKKWKDECGNSHHEKQDSWELTEESDQTMEFFTVVNNFDLEWFLQKLKIPSTEYKQTSY